MTVDAVLASATPVVEVLGIRHHGPGSARSVLAALDALRPDTVLIEGPADADPLLGFVSSAGMTPPVALLGYATDDPGEAVFWPFAIFSPEWQALRWAAEHRATARFCDLPSTAVLAQKLAKREANAAGGPDDAGEAKAMRRTARPTRSAGPTIPAVRSTAGCRWSRRGSRGIRWRRWPRRLGMTIPSAGGTTSSSRGRPVARTPSR
jgi:hypothetical protein